MELAEPAQVAFWRDLWAGLQPPPELTVDQWAVDEPDVVDAGGDARLFAV